MRAEEAKQEFERSIVLSRDGVERAKHFLVGRIDTEPVSSSVKIRAWWVARKAPPIEKLVIHDDYDFPEQCQRAARYWESVIQAAQALNELVREGYLESPDPAQLQTAHVTQGFTTVVEHSGGTTAAWDIGAFDVAYPSTIRRGPFSKPWDQSPRSEVDDQGAADVDHALLMTVIRDPIEATQALQALEGVERELNTLAESNVLSELGQEILVSEALPLLRALREAVSRVAATESERRGLVHEALVGVGKTIEAVAVVGRIASGINGLGKIPGMLDTGLHLVESIGKLIG